MKHVNVMFVFVVCIALGAAIYFSSSQEQVSQNHRDLLKAGKVNSETCISCHQQEGEKWHGSHHQKAMAVATDETVLGDFNNTTFRNPKDGVTTRFFKQGEKFMTNTQGPDGEMRDYEVLYTFGVEPLQQYMIRFPKGRIQCLPVAWDALENKWYHLFPKLNIDHQEWLHWSRGGANWNAMCADCHSTTLKKNYDPLTESYTTSFSEINVSCQACHGDGAEHVAWAKDPKGPYKKAMKSFKITEMNSKEQVDSCARCHSRRNQITSHFDHSGSFMDHYTPEILRQGETVYHGDGQISGEVYVYGSFVQSKMYHKEVRCTNCHDPHTTKIKFQGNALCLQCHKPEEFDVFEHHRHQVGSEGAQCVNCHMPGKIYMGNDFRRDHSFRIPRPDQSVKHNNPNACNMCHTDKEATWAADAIVKWHGPIRKPHFSDVLLKGWEDPGQHLDDLISLATNQEEPAIVRATVVWMLASITSNNEAIFNLVAEALKDKEAIVRQSAAMGIQEWPEQYRFNLAMPLLDDSSRSVRIRAAALLVGLPVEKLQQKWKEPHRKAHEEYMKSLEVSSDFPSGQMNLGNHYLRLKKEQEAIKAYEKAIEIDNRFNAARMNLSRIYSQMGENEKSKELLKKVVDLEPDFWGGWYSFGLLLNEMGKPTDASLALEKAAKLSSGNPRVYQNWGLVLQTLGHRKDAEKIFLKALTFSPNNPELLDKLAILYIQMEDWSQAETNLNNILRLVPKESPLFKSTLERLDYLRQQKK